MTTSSSLPTSTSCRCNSRNTVITVAKKQWREIWDLTPLQVFSGKRFTLVIADDVAIVAADEVLVGAVDVGIGVVIDVLAHKPDSPVAE